MCLKMLFAVVIVSVAGPAVCQVAPDAKGPGVPLTVGVGYSNYATDWSGRLSGPTLWVDWNFFDRPAFLHGFGIEAEARDLNYDRTGNTSNLRMDTVVGGPVYTWRRYSRFNPYVKFLLGYGSIDFSGLSPTYKHDTRTVYATAGGIDYRIYRNVWVRGNYEYQFWTDFFHHNALNPQGVTVGLAYDLGGIRGR